MIQPLLEHLRLEGERVALVPASEDLARAIYPQVAEATDIFQWLYWQGPKQEEDMTQRWATWRACRKPEEGAAYTLAVLDLESGQPMGELGLTFAGQPFTGNLSYWLLPAFHGAGRGREAVALALGLAFGHLRSQLLLAEVFQGNTPSERLLRGFGFRVSTEDASLRALGRCAAAGSDVCPDGAPLDTYTLGRRTWLARAPLPPPKVAEIR